MSDHRLSFLDIMRLSLRIFTVKPVRALLTIAGMAIGIGTVVFLVSLGYGLQYVLLGKIVTSEDSLVTLGVSYPSEANLVFTSVQLESLGKVPGVGEVSPVAEFSGEARHGDATGLLLMRVIQPGYFRLAGTAPDMGLTPDSKGGVVITNQAARLMGLPPDESTLDKDIEVRIQYSDEQGILLAEAKSKSNLPIAGIITDEQQPPIVFVLESDLLVPPPSYKEVFIKAASIAYVEKLRDSLTEEGFLISARLDLVNQAQKVLTAFTVVLGVFGVAALVVSAVGMFNTMIVSFMERIYEVGVMKSLGATDRDVRDLFLMESLVMGLAGGATGLVLGYGGGQLVNFGLNVLSSRLGGNQLELFILPLWFVGLVLASSSLIGVVSGFWPATRASYLSPKEAFLRK